MLAALILVAFIWGGAAIGGGIGAILGFIAWLLLVGITAR